MRRAVVVVGKAPEPGRTKTRLSPPLLPEQAAALSAAFLADTVAQAELLRWDSLTVVFPPHPGARSQLRRLLPPTVKLRAQVSSGLGAALEGAFASHFARGFDQVVLIGSDTPTLSHQVLADASQALCSSDLVLGPSDDGGYYLIGLNAPRAHLFHGIRWSSASVYPRTMSRARQLQLRVRTLPPTYDVDIGPDLARLRQDLAELPDVTAPRTRAVLASLC